MVLHYNKERHWVKALLDTGCSIALINEKTAKTLGLERLKHRKPHSIESYTGDAVQGAGQFYTKPLRMQDRRHYTTESFELSPMDPEIDIFLPFD